MACGSCHDDIDFAAGEGHPVQNDDTACGNCHAPDGEEYDLSVVGSHTVEYKSTQLTGVLVEIISVEDTEPGDRPKVTFSLSDKNGPLAPSALDRLRLSISGPNKDFTFYVQETATDNLKRSGTNWEYRFAAALPDDAMGSFSIGAEGRKDAVIDKGGDETVETEDQMQNFIEPFAVTDDMAMDRRMVVDDAKCENCHANLSLHGGNRHDANGYCQTCHMPSATDARVRPEGTGEPESIDFRYMIHKIHRGAELENGYVVYGYRSSLHDYSDVHYVGDLRNCDACHVEDSQQLPLPEGLESVVTPRDRWSPMLPETASCLSCHDDESSAVHADSNSTDLGEACATCHGEGKTYSVDAVHAR
jgi:OmcA/MtrC family decaheme c-type cytochrome